MRKFMIGEVVLELWPLDNGIPGRVDIYCGEDEASWFLFNDHEIKKNCGVELLPLNWERKAVMIASEMRRAGVRVDGACVDADGWMWFWIGSEPKPGIDQWYGGKTDALRNGKNEIVVFVGVIEGVDWKTMIIKFDKE